MEQPNGMTKNIDFDPFNLTRFVIAQENVYAAALTELRDGYKRSLDVVHLSAD